MQQNAISPPPKESLIDDINRYAPWQRWFSLITATIPKMQSYSPSIDPSNVLANSESVQTFTVLGLSTNDVVIVNKPTNTAGLDIVQSWVPSTNSLSLKFRNNTAGGIDAGSEIYRIIAIRL